MSPKSSAAPVWNVPVPSSAAAPQLKNKESPLATACMGIGLFQPSSDVPETLPGSGALLKTLRRCKQSAEMTVQVT